MLAFVLSLLYIKTKNKKKKNFSVFDVFCLPFFGFYFKTVMKVRPESSLNLRRFNEI